MADINCPICGKDDMVQKVTAIVQGETHTTSGYSATVGSSTIEGRERLYTSGGNYVGQGNISGNSVNRSYTDINATQQSNLARRLAPPPKPSKPVKQTQIDGISNTMIIIVMGAVGLLAAAPIGYLPGAFIWVAVWIIGSIIWINALQPQRRLKHENLEEKYKLQLKEYESTYAAWEAKVQQWSKLYYCRRDDVVYVPGDRSSAVEPSRMQEIL